MPETRGPNPPIVKGKVAYRLTALFIICVFVPVSILAVLSFNNVKRQFLEQGQRRLSRDSKAISMGIYERLLFLDVALKTISMNLSAGHNAAARDMPEDLKKIMHERFEMLAHVSDAGVYTALFGPVGGPPQPTADELVHLRSGKALVQSRTQADRHARIFVSRLLDPGVPGLGLLIGEVSNRYLWGIADRNMLPPMSELSILDESNDFLLSTHPDNELIQEPVLSEISGKTRGQFEWEYDGERYQAGYRSVFMKPEFFTPGWTVVLSEPESYMLAPMDRFKKTFPYVVLLLLLVASLLCINLINRSLIPLKKLHEGTRRIADKDFDSRIDVSSGDEFDDLAASFNTMAGRLGRQFKILSTIAEVDRAILSVIDTDKIVATVLTTLSSVFTCDCVSVTLFDCGGRGHARTYINGGKPEGEKVDGILSITPEEETDLMNSPEGFLLRGTEGALPGYLELVASRGYSSFHVLPILLKQKLSGVLIFGFHRAPRYEQEDMGQARQFADQIAVALSNAELIKDLEELNWGTLNALARSIDAKSEWTMGHSTRVTDMAVSIGTALKLPPEKLDTLHRAGLLHDIGKIGVPQDILDKPGKLTDEELGSIREHPVKSKRILEPIGAYREVLSMVVQHHERYDGKGYPDGLAGESICIGARILAVADSFDAMVSNRPYRCGMPIERVIEIITSEAGTQFDPEVVDVFKEVVARRQKESGSERRAVA